MPIDVKMREDNFFGNETDGISDDFFSSCRDIAGEASVMIGSRSNVPASFTMKAPCVANSWFLVYYHSCSWWCERCFVEVMIPPDVGIGG